MLSALIITLAFLNNYDYDLAINAVINEGQEHLHCNYVLSLNLSLPYIYHLTNHRPIFHNNLFSGLHHTFYCVLNII